MLASRSRLLADALAALALALALGAPVAAQPAGEEPGAAAAEAAAATAPAGQLVDGIAAQVGTEVVLMSEVERAAEPIEAKVREAGGSDRDVALVRSDILDKLIERKLIQLVAKRAEIEANDFEVDDAIAQIAKENGLTVEQLRESVAAQGLSYATYRKHIAEEIVQSKVLGGMVRSRATVEEAEIRKLYDQRYGAMPAGGAQELRLLHMAVGADDGKPSSVAAACDKVRRGLARVRAGASFESVANEVSQAAPDLGWLPAYALAPWMQQAVTNLEPGQVSGVVELPIGCAVLMLVDRREVTPLSYEEAKPQLRALLAEQAFQEEYVKFVDRLRKQTYVERKGVYAEMAGLDVASPPSP